MKSIFQSKTLLLHGLIVLVMSFFIGTSPAPDAHPTDVTLVVAALQSVGIEVPAATGLLVISALTILFRVTATRAIKTPTWIEQVALAIKENFGGSGGVARAVALLLMLPIGYLLYDSLSTGLSIEAAQHLGRDGLPGLVGLATLLVYTKADLKAHSLPYFRENPAKDRIFATSDGNFFWQEKDRDAHIREELRHGRIATEDTLGKFVFFNPEIVPSAAVPEAELMPEGEKEDEGEGDKGEGGESGTPEGTTPEGDNAPKNGGKKK